MSTSKGGLTMEPVPEDGKENERLAKVGYVCMYIVELNIRVPYSLMYDEFYKL